MSGCSRALTHASARSKDAGTDYERMEFLGDRVLGLVVAEFLYRKVSRSQRRRACRSG